MNLLALEVLVLFAASSVLLKVRRRLAPLRPLWMDIPAWTDFSIRVPDRLVLLARRLLLVERRMRRKLLRESAAIAEANAIRAAWEAPPEDMSLTDPRIRRVDSKGRPVSRWGTIVMKVVSTTDEHPTVPLPLPPASSAKPSLPSLASMRQHLAKVVDLRRSMQESVATTGKHASPEASETEETYEPRHAAGDYR